MAENKRIGKEIGKQMPSRQSRKKSCLKTVSAGPEAGGVCGEGHTEEVGAVFPIRDCDCPRRRFVPADRLGAVGHPIIMDVRFLNEAAGCRWGGSTTTASPSAFWFSFNARVTLTTEYFIFLPRRCNRHLVYLFVYKHLAKLHW